MSRQFDYDWFIDSVFQKQQHEARLRCTRKRFPDVPADCIDQNHDAKHFMDELEVRTLLYLRDGFSYEIKELVDVGSQGMLTFECEPVDEQYRVGAFVVTLQFEEIVRIEVFAVHPSEKPEDTPVITGFRTPPPIDPTAYRDDNQELRDPRGDISND